MDIATNEEDKDYEVTFTFTGKTSLLLSAASPEEAAYLAKCVLHEAAEDYGTLFFDVTYIDPDMKIKEYHEPKPKKLKKK